MINFFKQFYQIHGKIGLILYIFMIFCPIFLIINGHFIKEKNIYFYANKILLGIDIVIFSWYASYQLIYFKINSILYKLNKKIIGHFFAAQKNNQNMPLSILRYIDMLYIIIKNYANKVKNTKNIISLWRIYKALKKEIKGLKYMEEITKNMLKGSCCAICGKYFKDPDKITLKGHGHIVACKGCYNENCVFPQAFYENL